MQNNKINKIKIKKNICIFVFAARIKDAHPIIRRAIIFEETLNFKEAIFTQEEFFQVNLLLYFLG